MPLIRELGEPPWESPVGRSASARARSCLPAAPSRCRTPSCSRSFCGRGSGAGRALIEQFGSLSALFGAEVAAFGAVPGIGTAKYAQLQAAFELARRALRETSATGDALASPGAVRDYLRLTLENRAREAFVAVLLDAQHRVIAQEELFQGTLTQTSVYPREVVKCAVRHNAAAVIFAHNHPSGVAEPSQADQTLTETLKRALALIDVRVLDHFVIGRGAATSFAERGLI